ncbi:thioredoxin [Patescibacteria group bacterium]|nr:thioredoxin [Patescibacteria group bacterium]
MAGATVTIDDKNFEEEVVKSKTPVMVDFWAPWCGPCKMAGPIIDELAEEYKGKVKIGKLNVDENQEQPAKFGVMSIPTVILYKDGKEVERKIGFGGKAGYEELLKKAS